MQFLKLIRSTVWFGLLTWMTASIAKDTHYYSMHPQALQQAMQQCASQPTDSCEQLHQLAERMNNLAYELHMNPQEYGLQIIALQTSLAQQPTNTAEFAALQQNLRERLAIIKWLESPESGK